MLDSPAGCCVPYAPAGAAVQVQPRMPLVPSTKDHGFKVQDTNKQSQLPAVAHLSVVQESRHTSTGNAPSPPDWHRRQPAACRKCCTTCCCRGMPLSLVHCRMAVPTSQCDGSMPSMAAAACSSAHTHLVHRSATSMTADACGAEQGTSCGSRRTHYMQSEAGHQTQCCLQG